MSKRKYEKINGATYLVGSRGHMAARAAADGTGKPATAIKRTATKEPAAETVTIERRELDSLNSLLAARTREFNASQSEAADLRRRLYDTEATLINLQGALAIAVRRVHADRASNGGVMSLRQDLADEYPF